MEAARLFPPLSRPPPPPPIPFLSRNSNTATTRRSYADAAVSCSSRADDIIISAVVAGGSSLHQTLLSSSNSDLLAAAAVPPSDLHPLVIIFLADSSSSYSQASYYTSLGLFVISVPGLWSLIKRSVKSKIVQKTFTMAAAGAGDDGKNSMMMMPNQVAGAILSFFIRNNFVVLDRGETVTFEGMMVPSRSQAALLTFCTCISLASVALVLTITLPDVGNNWFWVTALSPLAGAYYWTRASRKEQIKVKMVLADDGTVSEIIVQGDDQQVDRLRKELQLTEKGMIYVKGIFES